MMYDVVYKFTTELVNYLPNNKLRKQTFLGDGVIIMLRRIIKFFLTTIWDLNFYGFYLQ